LSEKKKKLNKKQADESLEEQMSDISDAFRAEHETKDSFIWVAQTFEDHVIIEESGAMFKVGFVEEEGDFIFDGRTEWVEVERKVEFIEKSARAFIRQTGINALKTLSKTKDNLVVGNYIVLFGDEDNRDLDKEWFTEKTQLESAYTKTGFFHVDWEHGHGKALDGKDSPSEDDVLGSVDWSTLKVDDVGAWVERVLQRRNQYMTLLEPLIDEKMLGTSSLAVGAGVKVNKSGEIEKWPLKRDTLTVIPAEPRMMSENAIASLKSLVKAFPQLKANLPSGSGDDPDATAKPEEKPSDKAKSLEVINMKTKEDFLKSYAEKYELKVEDLTDKQKYIAWYDTEFAVEEPIDEAAEVGKRMTSLEESMKSMSDEVEKVLQLMKDAPAIKNSGYYSQDGEEADPDSVGLGDFLLAVQRKDIVRLKSIYKSTWKEEKTDMSHLTGSTGGFLIPPEFENTLLQLSVEMSPLTQMVTVIPVKSNRGAVPVLNQTTAPTAGQGDVGWTAGVTAGVGPENTALSETNPAFNLVEWNIHKVGGITQAPNELIEDSPMSIEIILAALFSTTINSRREFLILNGTGAGEALGILNSGAIIAVTTAGNNAFVLADALAMLAVFKPYLTNGIWVAHPGVIPDIGIIQVGSGEGVWMKDPSTDTVFNKPLLGKQLIYSEHLPQDDNSGDVILIDPKAYLLFQKRGMRIDFSEHVAFKEDQGTWRFTDRMDGQPWVSGTTTLADPQGSYAVSPFVKHHD